MDVHAFTRLLDAIQAWWNEEEPADAYYSGKEPLLMARAAEVAFDAATEGSLTGEENAGEKEA